MQNVIITICAIAISCFASPSFGSTEEKVQLPFHAKYSLKDISHNGYVSRTFVDIKAGKRLSVVSHEGKFRAGHLTLDGFQYWYRSDLTCLKNKEYKAPKNSVVSYLGVQVQGATIASSYVDKDDMNNVSDYYTFDSFTGDLLNMNKLSKGYDGTDYWYNRTTTEYSSTVDESVFKLPADLTCELVNYPLTTDQQLVFLSGKPY